MKGCEKEGQCHRSRVFAQALAAAWAPDAENDPKVAQFAEQHLGRVHFGPGYRAQE